MASPYNPYGFLSMTLMVMRILLPIRTGSIGTGWLGLRQTGISQCGYAILPLRVSLNDLIVKENRERLIPIGGIETQSIAQRPSSSTSPHCESKVEFRPGHAPTARLYDFRRNSYDFCVFKSKSALCVSLECALCETFADFHHKSYIFTALLSAFFLLTLFN